MSLGREKRIELEERLEETGRRVFQSDLLDISVSTDISDEERHTNIYGHIYVRTSMTEYEKNQLSDSGLRFVEAAPYVRENPAMNDSLNSIDREELKDAAESSIELIFEFKHI